MSKMPPVVCVESKKFSGAAGLAPLNGPWFSVLPVKKNRPAPLDL